ncbi:MAG: DUF3465 domain-containing protein [Coriobacteriia bacterium]
MIQRIALLIAAALLLTGSTCVPDAILGEQALGTDQTIENAYEDRRNDLQVAGSGTVIRTLADDHDGSRHQRFILELESGHTLLIAHNIDVAPRIPDVREGDTVEFYGVYEYNDQGGVIHWTHHDPEGLHEGGWLKHEGAIYQ